MKRSSYVNTDKTMHKCKSQSEYRETAKPTIQYLWPSSIPESWQRLEKKKICNIKIRKANRNTINFLEETQKYIENICKPFTDDIFGTPRKLPKFLKKIPQKTVLVKPSTPYILNGYINRAKFLNQRNKSSREKFTPTSSSLKYFNQKF